MLVFVEQLERIAAMTSLADIVFPAIPCHPDDSCDSAYERFCADPDLLAIPIVEAQRPVGLINRLSFLSVFSHRFGRALYEKKAVADLMVDDPLIVDIGLSIDDLNHLIIGTNPAALLRGFIVTAEDRYAGIGTALSLLTATAALARDRSRFEALSKELQAQYIATQQSSEAKSNFLAVVSHELRTPLNAITGFSEVILTSDDKLSDSNMLYIENIYESGRYLSELVDNILSFSQMTSGVQDLTLVPISLSPLAEFCIQASAKKVAPRTHRVRTSISDEIRPFLSDQHRLSQIIIHLLSNARKFSADESEICLTSYIKGDELLAIVIEDQGCGIPAEKLQTIFDPFVQLELALTRRSGGVGLGLTLAKGWTELLGGRLAVISTPGAGTKVEITLPYRTEDRDVSWCRANRSIAHCK